MSNGKGDTTRPPSVPRDTFAANWDRTFRDVLRKVNERLSIDERQYFGEPVHDIPIDPPNSHDAEA